MADKPATFRQVIREASREANLSVRDRLKLRIVMRVAPERLEQELFNHAQVEGFIPVNATMDNEVGAVDWAALAEFIKEVLPAILQIISLFL
jgi:hypothetical protein